MSVIPALGRPKQETCKPKASLSYTEISESDWVTWEFQSQPVPTKTLS